jgi:uncharacterized membrane protein
MLILLSIHCAVLIFFRMQYTGNHNYGFLLWNLFLAWVPFWLSNLVLLMRKHDISNWLTLLPVGGWLLFLPNAPYILTDLFHLHRNSGVPQWFDLLMIVSTGWTGLLLGLISMINIHRWLREIVPGFVSWFLMTGTAFAAGFGVYLGRYVRWNSWDILAQPKPLLRDIVHRLLDPFEHPALVGVTMILGFLLIGTYATLWLFRNQPENA